MKVNFGFFINKLFRLMNRPALRDCQIDHTAKVGTGSNCIGVRMGRYSYMGKNNSVAATTIGSFCSIASYCSIGGGAHPLNTVSTSPVFYEGKNGFNKHFSSIFVEKNKAIEIGNDVWIGEAVFIKDGVKIGTGAVIGAHSVVTKDVPPYAIVAGTPAKVIRYRFDEETIQRLLDSKWWEWPDDELTKWAKYFDDAEHLFQQRNAN